MYCNFRFGVNNLKWDIDDIKVFCFTKNTLKKNIYAPALSCPQQQVDLESALWLLGDAGSCGRPLKYVSVYTTTVPLKRTSNY